MDWTQRYKWGITALIIVFLAFNAWLLTMSFSQDISLVDEDYYAKDLAYQQTIDELRRTGALEESPKIFLHKDQIRIQFPVVWLPNLQSGNIQLYRPSDAGRDQLLLLSPDEEGLQIIPAENLIAGRWVVKIRWLMGDKWYQTEQPLSL